tara:strand:+ start:1588 stop:1719 length:132 start_codon:yes stop_codon:yes gene_type:complete
MIKKEWLWMPDLKTKTGLQGSGYYKPIKTNKHEINKRNSKENS